MIRRSLIALAFVAACNTTTSAPTPEKSPDPNPTGNLSDVPGHDTVAQDNTHKEAPRLVPAEDYIRTYLKLFGGLAPMDAQVQLQQGGAGLFDSWNSYLGALGLPNYVNDFPRGTQTNALMIATFDRIGTALCDKALEKDLKSQTAVPVGDRLIFAFDVPKDPLTDVAAFSSRFDVLHRTFLSYPAKLAPTDRTNRFWKLYQDTVAQHDPKKSKLTATEAGFAAVCYGLVRHPEFHLY